MIRWLILFFVVSVIEIYAFQAFKTVFKNKTFLCVYVLITLFVIGYIAYQISRFDRSIGQTQQTLFTIGLMVIFVVPKFILTFVLLLEDIFRVFSGVLAAFCGDNTGEFLPERRTFVSQIAFGLAAIPFVSLLYGMQFGKYNFKVIKQSIFFDDLPDAFDGFTITHISDIHSGSLNDEEKVAYAIDLINQQQSDVLLFTGDIVNSLATEMDPWMEAFNKLEVPKYGKFAVLGNHDYGAYLDWKGNNKARQANFDAIKDCYKNLGFKLLLNENVKFSKDNQQIALVGVENWGKKFGEFGDIDKAAHDLDATDFKVLMSHDPSHWEHIVKQHNKHFQLTLSGHTHGFQFGIEIPGFIRWSPVQYVYKQWAGLYKEAKRYIYVNRGFGFHGFPGRVGVWPEITVITLKKSKNV